MKPRIRAALAPYQTPDGRVRIGGGLEGRAAELDDPTGARWTLLMALDGTRSHEQAVDTVRAQHPDTPLDDITNCLKQLEHGGFIYDADEPAPGDLDPDEQTRYRPARDLYEWTTQKPLASRWDPQRALRDATVTILGVGGAGGSAAELLARSGIGTLQLVDPDVVELSNLGRQAPYTTGDLGHPKVDAASAHLNAVNPHPTIVTRQQSLSTEEEISAFLAAHPADILLLAADEPGLHARTNRACLAAGQTWIESGYDGPQILGTIYTPGHGPCWGCLRLGDADRLQMPVQSAEDLALTLPKAPGNPASAVTTAMSGAWAAHLTIAALTGSFPWKPGHLYTMNLLLLGTPDMVTVEHHPRRADCPDCGTHTAEAASPAT